MKKYDYDQVKECYELSADQYAKQFLNELDGKPFDRNILDRFNGFVVPGGLIYDFGCGSGQTTKYLSDKKSHTVIGIDFSEASIALAGKNFPEISFIVDNMLQSKISTESADGVLAFYAIVHFTYKEVLIALKEWYRILKSNGFCLFSFHVGNFSVTASNFLDVQGARATWNFLNVDKILGIAEKIGFIPWETVVRYPYKGKEHESKRAYIILKK